MKVKVTADHIAKGERANGAACPIALALRDLGYTNPQVRHRSFYVGYPYLDHYKMSDDVACFISRFDMGRPVEPFEFEAELVTELEGV
jgi:hypothetical protein